MKPVARDKSSVSQQEIAARGYKLNCSRVSVYGAHANWDTALRIYFDQTRDYCGKTETV